MKIEQLSNIAHKMTRKHLHWTALFLPTKI